MVHCQRSFFDEPPNADVHRPWYKKRQPLNGHTMSGPLQRPDANPITASTQSRSKLQAFQFKETSLQDAANLQDDRPDECDKENAGPEQEMHPEGDAVNSTYTPPCPSSQKSNPQDTRECPQTPVGRLPLSQLLANGDDASQQMDMTPVERVLWENSPLDLEKSISSQPLRKRKRASSSTPPSASQINAPRLPTPKRAQALQEAFKTPKANIGDDLWSRYSLHTHGKDPTSPTGMQLPHTFHSSSPQTPASKSHARDSGGLRRAFSNIDWPTSDAKRRKLRSDVSERQEAFKDAGIARPLSPLKQLRASRVSRLVDKLHNDLARPAKRQEPGSDDSTSSPVARSPETKTMHEQQGHESNVTMQQVVAGLSQTVVQDLNPHLRSPAHVEDQSALSREDASSEFGGGDIDFELFEAIAGTERQRPQKCDGAGDYVDEMKYDIEGKREVSRVQAVLSLDCIDGNDFDDEHEELFSAEMENVLAKYDLKTMDAAGSESKDGQPVESDLKKDFAERQHLSKIGAELPCEAKADNVQILSDDDYGSDSDFEQLAATFDGANDSVLPKQNVKQCEPKTSPTLERFVIKNIFEGDLISEAGAPQPEKVLYVQGERHKMAKTVLLRQAWVDSPCSPGMIVHVAGDFDKRGQCVIDNDHNFLILHPDHLISSTVVGDSFTCMRKAVLQDRVKATSEATQSTIYGHILHEIFQEAMRANRWDNAWMLRTIEAVSRRHLEELFEVNIELDTAINALKERATELQVWAEVYISAKPKPDAVIKDRNGAQSLMCINKLLEVEEKVWSPKFGLKGNVDATVQMLVDSKGQRRTLTVPFELKTGRMSNAAHKAQTSLYTLLLSDRYDINVACGVLWYMQTSEISSVRALRHELLPMILQRNILAGYVRQRTDLPPMLQRPYTCGKCFAKTTCFAYHKLAEDGTGESSGMDDKFEDAVRHLRPSHREFFRKWDSLLTKEENDVIKVRRELWTMTSIEREKLGRCFSGVVIEPGSSTEEFNASRINRFTYNFIKQHHDPSFNFLESQITAGEPIVISDERGHFALANGYVSSIRRNRIQVVIDRRLHHARKREKGFDAEYNQAFTGIMRVDGEPGDSSAAQSRSGAPLTYRVDKDEFSNGMALVRSNLVSLMDKDLFGVHALRRLIVEGVAPTFHIQEEGNSKVDPASQSHLNVDQKAAIAKIMSAKDYALVLGMPGTGKTTMIAHIIRSLISQGKKVLLTSYTHSAVDNILLKLRKDNIGIFRIGALAKVHPEVQEFADLSGKPMETVEDLKRCYTRQVVATTCLGINHPIFRQRIFDYCIVDEASQITLPVCLGPIRMAKKFVLVGDHYQLPPLVQNREALEGGLDISLFKMLSDTHPTSVTNLEHQYRMCEDIMTLSNQLIYKGRLKCGTESVAVQSLHIPNILALGNHHHTPSSIASGGVPNLKQICLGSSPTKGKCWLQTLLEPNVKACFVNTDLLGPLSREVLETGSRITNPAEAALTTQLIESLLTVGVPSRDIGVITLYRSQLALMKRSLRHRQGIEMHTADRFQGRDKDVVVLSLVRSNEGQIVGDLLKDWRRVNVALTRARTKLLIFGSQGTLEGNALLKEMMKLMKGKGWWFDLPSGALEGHVWEEAGTQLESIRLSTASGTITSQPEKRGAAAVSMFEAEGKENQPIGMEGAPKDKIPLKQARLDVQGLIGKRPVLKDIVNDAS